LVLAREGRVVREWLRAESREQRVLSAFGDEVLSPCRGERGPLRVEAFLSRPERARSAASALTLLVNGRAIRDRALLRAVAQAYGSVLEPGRYPLGVVYLEIDPSLVDVNVHPQKAEVRFADGRAVGEALFRILADELSRAFGMPVAVRSWGRPSRDDGIKAPPFVPVGAPSAEPVSPLPWSFSPADVAAVASGTTETDARPYPLLENRTDDKPAFSRLSFVAQVRHTFLICEGPDGLYVLDQHAAAERVTFDRLRKAYTGRDVATQALLFPVSVEVTASDAAFVDEEQAAFVALGLDVRAIGPTTVAVHALPRLLSRAKPEHVVRDLIAEVTRNGGRGFSNAVDLMLATMACHGSVRAGDRLSPSEASALLVALDQVDFSGHCPHGRPIVTRIGWEELERKVGRR
jgi:DNA mismatch repair protein MutL